jgi:hypothetical protein
VSILKGATGLRPESKEKMSGQVAELSATLKGNCGMQYLADFLLALRTPFRQLFPHPKFLGEFPTPG